MVEDAQALEAPGGSLADRMKARRASLEKQKTEVFEVPGYEGIFAVEYRMLGWSRIRQITRGHAQVKDPGQRELNSAVDTLLVATVQLLEVTATGHKPVSGGWLDLARALQDPSDPEAVKLPNNPTPQHALLAIFGVEARVMTHYGEYESWLNGQRQRVDEDVVRDFERTG